jgi:PilZ domain-containing protein
MSNEPIAVHPRFALATTVMVRESGTGGAVLAQLKNISLSGCYLETPRQIPEDARVRVVLQLAEIRADVWGVIRRRDAKGLGIQFTNGSTVEDWKRLDSLIKQLQTTVPHRSASASSAQ